MSSTAQVIAAGNVQIGMDANGMYVEAKRVKAEMAALRQTMRETKNPAAEFEQKQSLLVKAFKEGKINASDLADRVQRLRDKYGVLNAGQQAAIDSSKRLAKAHEELASRKAREAAETENLNRALIEEARRKSQVSSATMAAVNAKWNAGGSSGSVMNAASMAGAGNITSLLSMGLKAGGVAALAMGSVEALKLAAASEKASVSFGVLTGSVEKGKEIYSEMKKLTASGLNLTDMQAAARTMLSFGVAQDKVVPSLKQIGEITGGDSLRFQMLSLAFSQSAAAGRLMGQDLLQMVNAGFNPLQEISRQTGKDLITLRKEMEAGAISFKMVQDAFASATGEGGKFSGMLEAQSKTLGGSWNQMWVQLKELGTNIGSTLGNVVTPVLQGIVELMKAINWWVDKLLRGLKIMTLAVADTVKLDFSYSGVGKFLEELEKADTAAKSIKSNLQATKAPESTYKPRTYTEDEKRLRAASKEYDGIADKMHERLLEIRQGKEAVDAKKFKDVGMTNQMITELQNLQRIVDWEEKQVKLKEEQVQLQKKLVADGQRIVEQFATPAEKLKKEVADLMTLLNVGAIDYKTFEAAGMDAAKKESMAKSMTYGSRDAYQQMFGAKADKQLEKLEQQRLLQQQILEVQKETRNKIQAPVRAYK